MKKSREIERIISILPIRAAEALDSAMRELDGNLNELRLRCDRPASLTVDGKNVALEFRCTTSEMRGVVLALCDGSPYAYGDAVMNGYIPEKNGVRCGVCPVKGANGSIDSISSICIRFPWEYEIPDGVCELCIEDSRIIPTLFYSPPGVGKTTVLRFLIKSLCSGTNAFRGAVVDTRHELYTRKSASDTLTDYIFGYEKGEGIELAVRSLSPEVIFCDEIGSRADADSIIAAENTGVPLIASAHASDIDSLFKRPQIVRLRENGVFERYIGIKRSGGTYSFNVHEVDRSPT